MLSHFAGTTLGLALAEGWQTLSDKQPDHIFLEAFEEADAEQIRLEAIKGHISSSLAIDSEDFADIPFNLPCGLGRAYELFGNSLTSILEEWNARLAAWCRNNIDRNLFVENTCRKRIAKVNPCYLTRVGLS